MSNFKEELIKNATIVADKKTKKKKEKLDRLDAKKLETIKKYLIRASKRGMREVGFFWSLKDGRVYVQIRYWKYLFKFSTEEEFISFFEQTLKAKLEMKAEIDRKKMYFPNYGRLSKQRFYRALIKF